MSEENNGSAAPIEAAPAPEISQDALESTETDNLDDVSDEAGASAGGSPSDNKEVKKQEAEIKKALKSFELKVNGKSRKVDIDMDNDDEVKKYLQKALASDEKFQEASTYKKQAEQLVEMLQKNPLSILKNPALGLDIRKLAEQVLLEDLEEQQKSPEQKKMEEYEKKLKAYEDEKTRIEEERKKMQLEDATKRQYEEVETSMISALEKADLPAEPFFVRRVADIWASAVESGWEDARLEDIMPYVENRLRNDFQSVIKKNADPDKLEKLIGKDVLDGYRKSKVSKMKKTPTTAGQMAQSTAKVDSKPANAPKKVRIEDIGGW
jgi:hypothetical protein